MPIQSRPRTHKELIKLHGKKIHCMMGRDAIVSARISVDKDGHNKAFIVHNNPKWDGAGCEELFGYKYSWVISSDRDLYERDNDNCTDIRVIEEDFKDNKKYTTLTSTFMFNDSRGKECMFCSDTVHKTKELMSEISIMINDMKKVDTFTGLTEMTLKVPWGAEDIECDIEFEDVMDLFKFSYCTEQTYYNHEKDNEISLLDLAYEESQNLLTYI